jgi:D-alanyl-D-alanine carboxypeptidase
MGRSQRDRRCSIVTSMPTMRDNQGREDPAGRMPRRRLLGAAGAAFAGAAFGGRAAAQEATPVESAGGGFPIETQLAMEQVVAAALAATYTPGALVGVWQPGGRAWVRAAGVGDVTTGAPVTLEDHVRIASNTKTFVATVVLQLAEEGALCLDDRLERYLSGVPNGSDITLRQVLGMTAGIHDFVKDPRIAVGYAADPLLPWSTEETLAIVRGSAPDFPPGERVQYSNSNYMLLGLIVEQVTGRTIGDAIAERIFGPLGMTGSSFADTPDMPEPYMHGYQPLEIGVPLVDVSRSNPDVPWASGAIVSTLADMRTWAEALATGSLLTPETQAERLRLNPVSRPGQSVGYGLGILSYNGLLGHNGGIPGYSSWLVHDPATGTTLAVVTNRSTESGGTADPIFVGIARILFPDRFPAAPAATPPA